jgi:hypothetical protein
MANQNRRLSTQNEFDVYVREFPLAGSIASNIRNASNSSSSRWDYDLLGDGGLGPRPLCDGGRGSTSGLRPIGDVAGSPHAKFTWGIQYNRGPIQLEDHEIKKFDKIEISPVTSRAQDHTVASMQAPTYTPKTVLLRSSQPKHTRRKHEPNLHRSDCDLVQETIKIKPRLTRSDPQTVTGLCLNNAESSPKTSPNPIANVSTKTPTDSHESSSIDEFCVATECCKCGAQNNAKSAKFCLLHHISKGTYICYKCKYGKFDRGFDRVYHSCSICRQQLTMEENIVIALNDLSLTRRMCGRCIVAVPIKCVMCPTMKTGYSLSCERCAHGNPGHKRDISDAQIIPQVTAHGDERQANTQCIGRAGKCEEPGIHENGLCTICMLLERW